MVTFGSRLELGIAFGRGLAALHVAVFASEVQSDLRQRILAILGELAYLVRVYAHHMGPDVPCELLGVPPSALGDPGHVALYAGHLHGLVGIGLIPGFLVVTIGALGSSGGVSSLPKLLDSCMGIVTDGAFENHVFALEELLVLLMMLYESPLGIYHLHCPTAVALSAKLRVPYHL